MYSSLTTKPNQTQGLKCTINIYYSFSNSLLILQRVEDKYAWKNGMFCQLELLTFSLAGI